MGGKVFEGYRAGEYRTSICSCEGCLKYGRGFMRTSVFGGGTLQCFRRLLRSHELLAVWRTPQSTWSLTEIEVGDLITWVSTILLETNAIDAQKGRDEAKEQGGG